MTPEEKRIAIAEARGWVNCVLRQGTHLFGCEPGFDTRKDPNLRRAFSIVPDYLNDLNAMHEAEKLLTEGQWLIYEHALQTPSALRGDYGHRYIIHATAAQRADAFLMTLGKLKS